MDDLIAAVVRDVTDKDVVSVGWVMIVEVLDMDGDTPRTLIVRHGNNDGPLPPWQVIGYITGAMTMIHH